jgi:hypothetical protein
MRAPSAIVKGSPGTIRLATGAREELRHDISVAEIIVPGGPRQE